MFKKVKQRFKSASKIDIPGNAAHKEPLGEPTAVRFQSKKSSKALVPGFLQSVLINEDGNEQQFEEARANLAKYSFGSQSKSIEKNEIKAEIIDLEKPINTLKSEISLWNCANSVLSVDDIKLIRAALQTTDTNKVHDEPQFGVPLPWAQQWLQLTSETNKATTALQQSIGAMPLDDPEQCTQLLPIDESLFRLLVDAHNCRGAWRRLSVPEPNVTVQYFGEDKSFFINTNASLNEILLRACLKWMLPPSQYKLTMDDGKLLSTRDIEMLLTIGSATLKLTEIDAASSSAVKTSSAASLRSAHAAVNIARQHAQATHSATHEWQAALADLNRLNQLKV